MYRLLRLASDDASCAAEPDPATSDSATTSAAPTARANSRNAGCPVNLELRRERGLAGIGVSFLNLSFWFSQGFGLWSCSELYRRRWPDRSEFGGAARNGCATGCGVPYFSVG